MPRTKKLLTNTANTSKDLVGIEEAPKLDKRTAYDERHDLEKRWLKLPREVWDKIDALRLNDGITRPTLIAWGLEVAEKVVLAKKQEEGDA